MDSKAGLSLCARCGKLDCDDAHSPKQSDTDVFHKMKTNSPSVTVPQPQVISTDSVSSTNQCCSSGENLKTIADEKLSSEYVLCDVNSCTDDKSGCITYQQHLDDWKRCQNSEKVYEYNTSTPVKYEGVTLGGSNQAGSTRFGYSNSSAYLNQEEICKSASLYGTDSSVKFGMPYSALQSGDMPRSQNVQSNQSWLASGVMSSSRYDPLCQQISPVPEVKKHENTFDQVNVQIQQHDPNAVNRFTYKGQLKREADCERMLEGERKHLRGSSYCQNGVDTPELSAGKETLAELITETQNILNSAMLPDGCLPQKLPGSCEDGSVTEPTCSSGTRHQGYKDDVTSYCWLPPNVALRDMSFREPTSLVGKHITTQYVPTDYGQTNPKYTFGQDSHYRESWSQLSKQESLYSQCPDMKPVVGSVCGVHDGSASVSTRLSPPFQQMYNFGEMGLGLHRSVRDPYEMPASLDVSGQRTVGKDYILPDAYRSSTVGLSAHTSSTTQKYIVPEPVVPGHYANNNHMSPAGTCLHQPAPDLSMYRADLMAPGTTLPPRYAHFPKRPATMPSPVPLQSLLLNTQGNRMCDHGLAIGTLCTQTKQHLKSEDQQPNLEKTGSSNSISVVYMGKSMHEKRQLAVIMASKGPMTWAMLDQCAGGTWSNADSRDIPLNMPPLKMKSPAMVNNNAIASMVHTESSVSGAGHSQLMFNDSTPQYSSDYSSLLHPVITVQTSGITSMTPFNGSDVETMYEIKPDSVNSHYSNKSVYLNVDKVPAEQSDSGYQSLSLTGINSEPQDNNYMNTNVNSGINTERRDEGISAQNEDHSSSYLQLTTGATDVHQQQTEISQPSYIRAAGEQDDEPSSETYSKLEPPSELSHPDGELCATRVQPILVIRSDAHSVSSFQSVVSNIWTDNLMPKMSTQVSVLPPVMSFLHPEPATVCTDTTVVSSTTQEYHTEVNCPKSRFFSLLGLNIGSYRLNEQDTRKRLSRVQFQFNIGKLTYEMPVMVQSIIQSGVSSKKSWHICLVDVSFSSIVGLHVTRTELTLEVNSAPVIRTKDTSDCLTDRHLLDPTGGEFSRCPYQKLILRPNVPRKIVDLLCMADKRFVNLYKHDLVIDKDKQLYGSTLQSAIMTPEPTETEIVMNKNNVCSCSFGCLFSRCKCAAAEQPCNDKCKCTRLLNNCINPVNEMIKYRIPMDVAKNDKCLMANIFRKKNLGNYLEKQVIFPCCGSVQVVNDVIPGVVPCPQPGCTHTYMYSWCLEKLMDTVENPRHHCDICSTCAHPNATQCPSCNSCLLPTSDVSECPSQDMQVIHLDNCVTNVLPENNATREASGGVNSIEQLTEAKGKTEQCEDDQEVESILSDSETESDTEMKGNGLGFIFLTEKAAESGNNIRLDEHNVMELSGDNNSVSLHDYNDSNGRNVNEVEPNGINSVCHIGNLKTHNTSFSVGETKTDQSAMEMTFSNSEMTCSDDCPVLAGGAVSHATTTLAETPEENMQVLCNKSNDLGQLEKSFSTSLNLFVSLSPSCQSMAGDNIPLPVLIPLNLGVDGNHNDGSVVSYLHVPSYMDNTEASSNSDHKDIVLCGKNEENVVDLPTQQVPQSSKVDISAVLPALPVAKIVRSTEIISLSNVSNFQESVMPTSSLQIMGQEEKKHDNQHDQPAPDNMALVISQSNTGEPVEGQNLFTVATTVQGGIVEDISVSWPLCSSDTSCVLGEPLKTSSPVTSLL